MATDLTTTCPVCQAKTPERDTRGDRREIDCPRCGSFVLSRTLVAILQNSSWDKVRMRISAWIRSQLRDGAEPLLSEQILTSLRDAAPASPLQRMDSLLLEFDAASPEIGTLHYIGEPRFYGAAGTKSAREMDYLGSALSTSGFLDSTQGYQQFKILDADTGTIQATMAVGSRITPAGYARIAELKAVPAAGRIAFVAMSFDPSLTQVYSQGIEPGISAAGYEAKRVDKHEHNNRIDDQIIAMLNTCSFVVADFTQHRAGVYFEAGYGLGLRHFGPTRRTVNGNLMPILDSVKDLFADFG